MRKLALLLVLFVCAINTYAQTFVVKSVIKDESHDITSYMKQRKDPTSGKLCALVRFAIVGVDDMEFPEAVGDVTRKGREYSVYVPNGLTVLNYKNKKGNVSGSVAFSKYETIKIAESGNVYLIQIENPNHSRAAVFSVQPQTAKLTFDGNPVSLDEEGMAVIEKKVGEYRYIVTADGYESLSGTVKLTEDEISTTTDIVLDAKMHPVTIKSKPANASLFIDNSPYGSVSENEGLELSEGRHHIRLTAEGYDDYEQDIDIRANIQPFSIFMNQKVQEVIEFKKERTRHNVNLRPRHYITLGGEYYDKKKFLAHEWGWYLGYSSMQYFGGIFAIREGIGGGQMYMNKEQSEEYYTNLKDTTSLYFEIPLQIGISIPIGNYNRNRFSILAGGYGRVVFVSLKDKDQRVEPKNEEKGTNWDYGLRGTIMVDVSNISIGAEVSQSLNDHGLFFGLKLSGYF